MLMSSVEYPNVFASCVLETDDESSQNLIVVRALEKNMIRELIKRC